MTHGFHVIATAYGFWLPNDPRGSWSDYVRKWEMLDFSKATKVETTRTVASCSHDRRARFATKENLGVSGGHLFGPPGIVDW